jgi:hypothetical protein
MANANARTDGEHLEPLVVSPKTAWRMLGCGNSRGYELLNGGELQSFLDGRSRRITVASIRAYVARKLEAAGTTGAATQPTLPRRRCRPHKPPANEATP